MKVDRLFYLCYINDMHRNDKEAHVYGGSKGEGKICGICVHLYPW